MKRRFGREVNKLVRIVSQMRSHGTSVAMGVIHMVGVGVFDMGTWLMGSEQRRT